MYTYHKESFVTIVDDILPMIELHWEEIALYKDKVKLEPDLLKYRTLMDQNLLQAYSIRRDSELIAYMFMTVSPHLHYKSTIYAMNDLLYIDKKYRKTMVAYRLLKYVENELRKQGVHIMLVNMKLHAEFKNFLEGLGFVNTELIFSKYIGE